MSEIKPWKGICSPQCWNAVSGVKNCKCKCHMVNHGKGVMQKLGFEVEDKE